ncbi:MAG: hypothetical protein H6666_06110 [Ardenticatenaceae bacterium]|nr:hypothetical protein [Anaerolineales bacterium]MCB8917478.1 hypothetical protein [Ardenticatenaceae bacterium]
MNETTGGLKLILSYDVKGDAVQAYYRFMLGRYVPIMAEMGLEMSDAWHTAYGDQPNRLVAFIARDARVLRLVMESPQWTKMNEELTRYVEAFSYKVVPYREGFQF